MPAAPIPARENDGVPLAFRQLAQPCRHIAAKIDNLQVRSLPAQLMFSPHASGRNNPVSWQRLEVVLSERNQNVIGGRARQNRRDLRSRHQFTRQILRAVNREIDILSHKRALNFTSEQSLPPSPEHRQCRSRLSADRHASG